MFRRLARALAPAPDTLELQPFDALQRGEWTWTQPARFRQHWELRCDGAPVATLAVRGFFGGSIVARFAGESYAMHLRFPGTFVVTRDGSPEEIVRYRPGWFAGGRIERANHDTLLWRSADFWMRRWAITTTEQLPMVSVIVRPGFARNSARVELEDAARRLPDLAALVALAWVLLLQTRRGHSGAH